MAGASANVGDVVHLYLKNPMVEGYEGPLAGIVCNVNEDGTLHIFGISKTGLPVVKGSVPVGETAGAPCYCEAPGSAKNKKEAPKAAPPAPAPAPHTAGGHKK